MLQSSTDRREILVRRGLHLEYFTIFWNSLEAVAAVASGIMAGSVALVGFGLDSLIEVTSAVALVWRLHQDRSELRRQQVERVTLRIVGACFVLLAVYIAYNSGNSLLKREAPQHSVAGIIIATLSLVTMPLLARAKRSVSAGLGSAAMMADARQTDFCMYLSAILLGGLLLNALFGLWWADPIAALLMTPIIVKEGVAGWRGETCCSDCR
jgi:divalent metal cation (Fe/Co/Zn/Cd) transporter